MILGAGMGALLLLAAPMAKTAQPIQPGGVASVAFAPPLDRPLAYRVTTRRMGRDGTMLSFSLVYDLNWQRVGRGYRLRALLTRIDSDAKPHVTRPLTAMLEPLVGQEMSYLVAEDGSHIDLADPDRLWDRVLARTETAGATAKPGEAKQMASLLAALPAAERDRLVTADIRALIARANGGAMAGPGSDVRDQNGLRTITRTEQAPMASAAGPLEIEMLWTIDTATGLVVREQRRSWIAGRNGAARTLVEERERALSEVSAG